MRIPIRLATLALAGYGVWALYDRYGPRLARLRPPLQEFSDRATTAAKGAVDNVSRSADQAAGAVEDATSEVQRAAQDLADEATRRLTSDEGTGSGAEQPGMDSISST